MVVDCVALQGHNYCIGHFVKSIFMHPELFEYGYMVMKGTKSPSPQATLGLDFMKPVAAGHWTPPTASLRGTLAGL